MIEPMDYNKLRAELREIEQMKRDLDRRSDPPKSMGSGGGASSIRDLLRKYFPAKPLPPKPELSRPLLTGVVDFNTY